MHDGKTGKMDSDIESSVSACIIRLKHCFCFSPLFNERVLCPFGAFFFLFGVEKATLLQYHIYIS